MSTHKKENIQNGNKLAIQDVIKKWVWDLLTLSPLILGFCLIFFFHGFLPDTFLIALSFFIIGFTGITVMVHKEMTTGVWTFRGKWVILQGVLFAIICWGLVLYVLIQG